MADTEKTPQQVEPALNNPNHLSSARTAIIMVAVSMCMFAQGFSLFKLLPLQSAIMNYFNIEVGLYGYLNTAQSWLLIVCAVPIGFLVRKLPSKWSIGLAFAILALGTTVEITTHSYLLFVISRMVEGAGYSILSLSANSLVINMVKPKRVGFWASFMVVMAMIAQIIHTRVSTKLMLAYNLSLQTVLLIIGLIQAVCLIFAILVIPGSVRVTGKSSAAKPTREQTMRIYKSPSVWCVSLAMVCFQLALMSFNSYIIQFLVIRGMDQTKASTTFSYSTLISVFSMLFFGWLSGKLQTKRKIVMFSFFSGVLVLLLLAHLPIDAIFLYVLCYGTLPRSVAGLTTASAHDLAEVPADVPIVNSFKETVTHVGNALGGIATGYLLQYAGYYVTIYVLAGLMAVGGVLWMFAKKVP